MTTLVNLGRAFAYSAARVLPKTHTVVLRGFPSFEDNLIAIYSALAARSIDRVVWVVEEPSEKPPIRLREGTRLVTKGSYLDFYYSITAKYLFLTHGHFLLSTPPNQVSVNLWHGIPFKKIGRSMGRKGRSDTFIVATSEFTREIFSQSFGMSKDSIFVTGQARTDRFLTASKDEIWTLAFPGLPVPKKIFLWLPTYRDTTFLGGQVDGAVFANPFNCSDFSETAFNKVLKDNDAVCLLKPHPMAVPKGQSDLSNLRFIDEKWLQQRRLSLYQLLGVADCLISDISSVIADFMLLKRPIILLFEDIEAYEKKRGFSFNPITDFLPASVSRDFKEFSSELKLVLAGEDSNAARREELTRLFFEHPAGDAAERILDRTLGDTE